MTSQECVEERNQLLLRTAQLRARFEALRHPIPFSADDHAALTDLLQQHRLNLADFRRRCLKAGFASGV